MKRLVCILLVFVLTLFMPLHTFAASAASSAVFTSSQVEKGWGTQLTVNITAPQDFYSASFKLDFDSEMLEFVSCSASHNLSGDTVLVVTDTGSNSLDVVFVFRTLKEGETKVYVTDIVYADTKEYTVTDCSASVTVTAAVRGDANADGDVNTTDLAVLKKYLADASTQCNSTYADMDENGTVNTTDLAMLKKLLAGILV